MDESKMTTDRLREMLDTYSPEQQMEIDAQTLREITEALSEVASTMETFKSSVSTVIRDARRSVRYVSCPAIVALVLFSIFISLTLFAGIVSCLNYVFLDNDLIWRAAWISVGAFTFMIALTAFMRYMEWV